MAEPSPADVLTRLSDALGTHGRVALAHIVRTEGSTPGKSGWKLLITPDGSAWGNLGGGAFEAMVKVEAAQRLEQERPQAEIKRFYLTEEATKGEATGMVCGGFADVFLEVLEEAPALVICGGGPVGQALARAGDLAGFRLAVVDDRAEYRRAELFPARTRILAVGRDYEEDFLAELGGRDLYITVVTRCWETDTAALAAVLRQQPARLRYLGLMGSRRKIERVRKEVEGRGFDLSQVALKAPIGLPIGGASPGEIAVAVLAEIIEARYKEPEE